MSQITTRTFDKLTERQRDVLGQIAIGVDVGHHPATIRSLLKKGLITGRKATLSGRFPVKYTTYIVPTHVHIEWCAWCEIHHSEEDEETE